VVAVTGTELIGFHAATYTPRYINSYYQMVALTARGRGVAGAMLDQVLLIGVAHGSQRLKFKLKFDSDGRAFWEGFGLRPFGKDDVHLLYDVSISGVRCAADLTASSIELPQTVAAGYQRRGVQLLYEDRSKLF